MADLVEIDVFVHRRGERGVLLSRDGDARHGGWVALAHCELAMRGEVQALASMPRWAAEQAGIAGPRSTADQPSLFGRV